MARSEIQPTTPRRHVVAMPYPGRGHINPMLNLCRAAAENSCAAGDILVTVVVTEEWLGFLGSMEKPDNLRFAAIPNVVPSEHVRGDDLDAFVMAVLTKMGEPFDRLLDELSLPAPPVAIIADALLPWAAEVGQRRNIPVASLWTMSASVYTVFHHFDLLVQNGHFPIDLSANGDAIVGYIPGLPRTRLKDLPALLRDREIIPKFMEVFPHESKTKYLIFNSIYELESQVLDALKQKSGVSIFNVGPATSYFKLKQMFNSSTLSSHEDDHERSVAYLRWLDLQPHGSVLYVSLGSFLSVSRAQMDEIANGLCQSGVRHLLVARSETSRLQEICGEKGLVVGWCDQLTVLSHPSVGGFWSHCGWNSTKEAVLTGVPMLTSPIIMDQSPNAKAVVEDWKIGWRVMKGEFDEQSLVTSDEIAELVKRFMDLESPERKEITRNARKLKSVCEKEFESGQSFQTNIDGFVESIMRDAPL